MRWLPVVLLAACTDDETLPQSHHDATFQHSGIRSLEFT